MLHITLPALAGHIPFSSHFHACGIVRQGLFGNRRRQLGKKTNVKKASCPLHQKSLALTSSLASSSLADRSWSTSSCIGCTCSLGSVETSDDVSANSSAVKSRISL